MNQMKRAMDEALEAMHASPCLAERIVEAERSKKARGFRPLVVLAAALVVISVGVTAGSGRLWNVQRFKHWQTSTALLFSSRISPE